jgi:hypothetical protein
MREAMRRRAYEDEMREADGQEELLSGKTEGLEGLLSGGTSDCCRKPRSEADATREPNGLH